MVSARSGALPAALVSALVRPYPDGCDARPVRDKTDFLRGLLFPSLSETYEYYTLPFCKPEKVVYKAEDLGTVIDSHRLVSVPYDLSFRVDRENELVCSKQLTPEEVKQFRRAAADDYYFQMFYDDDLPLWGFIGKVEKIIHASDSELRYYLFTHLHFDISYNEDRVIEINLSTDPLRTVDITEDQPLNVQFSYSTKWKL
eukprot:scaffold2900_cov330-Prasinococcus_capsulatus_cf.AAC.4